MKKNSSILLRKALKDIALSMKEKNKCRQLCLKHVTEKMMHSIRYRFWAKSFEQRVEWFIDKIKERKHQRFIIDGGHNVCSFCFKLLLKINKTFYYKYLKKPWKENQQLVIEMPEDLAKQGKGLLYGCIIMNIFMPTECQIMVT